MACIDFSGPVPVRFRHTCGRILTAFAAFSLLTIHVALAQKHQIGLGLGGFNYAGDMARGYPLASVRPGGQLTYRYNFNNFVSLRGGFTGGLISGSDERSPIDAFSGQRLGEFEQTILELSAIVEYNFVDYKHKNATMNWSPYIFFGLAGFGTFGTGQPDRPVSPVQPAIPFGLGIKYMITPRVELMFEAGIRKVFYDYLDGYSDGDRSVKNYQYGNKYDDDWYSFTGISLHYTLFYIPCPYDFY